MSHITLSAKIHSVGPPRRDFVFENGNGSHSSQVAALS
jgi:hypothetical protein